MLSNESGSESFNAFINLLGDQIRLQNWNKYRGGLDVKRNTTGENSYYTVHEGREIMFHVSTMLPYEPTDRQQIERKRHIGNDIVVIIFQDIDGEEKPTFKPTGIKSHFTHVFALVTHNKIDNTYKLAVYSYNAVPLFGPPLHKPPVFSNHQEFRDFLLVKLINGEKASYHIPVFADKRRRTLEALIRNVYEDLVVPELLHSRSFLLSSFPGAEAKRKREEFLEYGTALKIDVINAGSAPIGTSSSRPRDRRQPWLPHRVCSNFPHSVICGDSWGDSLVVATEKGVFLVEGDYAYQELIDSSVTINQLNTVESHHILLMRGHCKGKDTRQYLYIVMLNEFVGDKTSTTIIKGIDVIKDGRLEITRGCHLYAVNQSKDGVLKVAVAIKARIIILTLSGLDEFEHRLQISPQDLIERFVKSQVSNAFKIYYLATDISLGQEPTLISVASGHQPESDLICVGYKEHFEIIEESTGDIKKVHRLEAFGQFEEVKSKKRHKKKAINLVNPVNVYDEAGKPEVFLTGNHVSFLLGLGREVSYISSYYWNHPPLYIVCAYPYLLGFALNYIEIRLVVNGCLVQAITFPEIQFITSKFDIYFATLPTRSASIGSNSSQGVVTQRLNSCALYKIPIMSLLGDELYMSRIKSTVTAAGINNSAMRPGRFNSTSKGGPFKRCESNLVESTKGVPRSIMRAQLHRIV
ncbi:GTPase-activating Rap/Ran-GAP domain-like protein 3 [Trichoplax sp. H2]|nr:GTPase-activating Rap/Ran-GAP domain-like protein 3 [Trichoplax sp. H2]|eukprot:RDD39906.1 GTPase-activating Rap/Ran-GAP domain-like protein 3 [Trichoplax sp. H2]